MYLSSQFAQTDAAALAALLRAHPLATLIGVSTGGEIVANHLPMLFDADTGPHGRLRGHIARANGAWRELAPESSALAIFQGPSAYVSPSWYPSKREHGRAVPTWNYMVAHIHGRLRFVHEEGWLHQLLDELARRHEDGRPEPWAIGDAPQDYVARQLRAIVGVELTIERILGMWKLSQNQARRDFDGAVAGLEREGTPEASAVAAAMRSIRSD